MMIEQLLMRKKRHYRNWLILLVVAIFSLTGHPATATEKRATGRATGTVLAAHDSTYSS